MASKAVTARFSTPEELEAALCDLRRFGAVNCSPAPGSFRPRGPEVLHFTVSVSRLSMARAVVTREGGKLLPEGDRLSP